MNANTPPATTAAARTATTHLRGPFGKRRSLDERLGCASSPSSLSSRSAASPTSLLSVSSTFSSSLTIELVMPDLSLPLLHSGSLVPCGDVELNAQAAVVTEGRFPEVEPVPGVYLDGA